MAVGRDARHADAAAVGAARRDRGDHPLIRWQSALFALLPACDALTILATSLRAGDRTRTRATLVAGLTFTACATLAFLPQMLAWKAIYGSYLAVSPVGPQIRWWDPHWSTCSGPRATVFSAGRPFFIAAPSASSSSRSGYRRRRPLAHRDRDDGLLQRLDPDWWGSAGFGGRRFDGTIPLFALGVAALADGAAQWTRRHPLRMVAAAGGLLVLWNLSMMGARSRGTSELAKRCRSAKPAPTRHARCIVGSVTPSRIP